MDIPTSDLVAASASALLEGSAALGDAQLAALAGEVLALRGPLGPALLARPTGSHHGAVSKTWKHLAAAVISTCGVLRCDQYLWCATL